MLHYKSSIIFLLASSLLGCSAAGVMSTNDPSTKISQAYELKSMSRPIPAQKLLQEALVIYKSEMNKQGEANVYLGFGDLYKSESYQSQAEIFKGWGEYQSYANAANYYLKAGAIFKEKMDYWSLSRVYGAAGDAYILGGDINKSCKLYSKVEETFNAHQSTFTSEQIEFTERLLRDFHLSFEC